MLNLFSYVYLENLAIRVSIKNCFYCHRQWRSPLSKVLPSQRLTYCGS